MRVFKYILVYENQFVGWTVSPNIEYLELFLTEKDSDAAKAKCLQRYFRGYGEQKLAQVEKCLRIHRVLEMDKHLAMSRSRARHDGWTEQLEELER